MGHGEALQQPACGLPKLTAGGQAIFLAANVVPRMTWPMAPCRIQARAAVVQARREKTTDKSSAVQQPLLAM